MTYRNESNSFVYPNYQSTPAFSGFLPGIAGVRGVPLWAFYVNRGQAVVSFGVGDKDGSIARYHSAVDAYRAVSEEGFRTFLAIFPGDDNEDSAAAVRYEPFQPESVGVDTELVTSPDSIMIRETNAELNLEITVRYTTLADEPVAALLREVSLRNIGETPLRGDVLDGLPRVIPSGIGHGVLTSIPTTAVAWMEAERRASGLGLFRARASVADTTDVSAVRSAHFAAGSIRAAGDGRPMHLIVDPDLVFPRNTRLLFPTRFYANGVPDDNSAAVRADGKFPCALFASTFEILPGRSTVLHEIFGHANDESLAVYAERRTASPDFFERAFDRSRDIVHDICDRADTRSGNRAFDAYCRQSFLDNVLRGGFPHVIETGEHSIVLSLFGRKHGDLERDYNWFVVPDEPYSQGPGNFRDVCQNRRLDVVHEPRVGRNTVREFFNLIQGDGYNPLVVNAPALTIRAERRDAVTRRFADHPEIAELAAGSFSAGSLHRTLSKHENTLPGTVDESVREILAQCEPLPRADHGEGYWIDHWTYIIDLLDSYLTVYPDREYELYFGDTDYRYFDNAYVVLPRARKWRVDERGLRRHGAVVHDSQKAERMQQRTEDVHWMRDENGDVYQTTLFEKMLCLAAVKFITRDPLGIGIEMEADRPGWCDALNGLPGLLGSSLSEVWDLIRLLRRIDDAAAIAERRPETRSPAETADAANGASSEQSGSLSVAEEVAELFLTAGELAASPDELQQRWHRMSDVREAYRAKTKLGFSGRKQSLSPGEIRRIVAAMQADLEAGLERGRELADGTYPTYLIAEPIDTAGLGDALAREEIPSALRFTLRPLPDYLEGQTKALGGASGQAHARGIHEQVLNGPLLDRKLGMLRLNASLEGESVEIGRARSFTPGWLENESIWLHMEYKYLLSLLKAGLYREFWSLARSALVPFLDPDSYGRSTYENCSFLAASCHPDETVHGRGFVARLTGATAEFLHMRFLCLVGSHPFRSTERGLELRFDPILPRDMFDERGTLHFRFLSDTTVAYRIEESDDLMPDSGIGPVLYRVLTEAGETVEFDAEVLPAPWADELRSGHVKEIEVVFARR